MADDDYQPVMSPEDELRLRGLQGQTPWAPAMPDYPPVQGASIVARPSASDSQYAPVHGIRGALKGALIGGLSGPSGLEAVQRNLANYIGGPERKLKEAQGEFDVNAEAQRQQAADALNRRNVESEIAARRTEAPESEPKTVETSEGVYQFNPESKKYDIRIGSPAGKSQPEPKTVDTGDGIFQYNDKTGRYDIKVGPSKSTEKPPTSAEGEWLAQFRSEKGREPTTAELDAHSKQEKIAGREPREPNEYADWKEKNPDASVEDYWAAKGSAVDPMTTRTMQAAAPEVEKFIERIEPQIDKLAKDLGPASGRWSEFWAGKVGAPKPEYTELRTNMTLLSTLLMRMHMGARGGQQIMDHFQKLLDQGAQSPENLHASLKAIKDYADDLISETPKGRRIPGGGGKKAGEGEEAPQGKKGDPLGIFPNGR